MSRQPEWKFVVNLGDADPINHGGVFVYEDKTGVYPPEMELLEPLVNDDGDSPKEWEVYRVILEPCTYVDGVLSDNPYHKDYPVWFADKLADVAECAGMPEAEFIRLLCSDKSLDRANAYYDLIRYFGHIEFDDYPCKIQDRKELRQRYRRGELK